MNGLASNLVILGMGYVVFVVVHVIHKAICEYEYWKENHF